MIEPISSCATQSTGAANAHSPQRLRALSAAGRKLDTQDPAVVRQTATQLAAELFFKPLLAEMRQFPLGRELTDGGRTEAIFGAQLDQRLADSAAAAATPLINQLTHYFDRARQTSGAVRPPTGVL